MKKRAKKNEVRACMGILKVNRRMLAELLGINRSSLRKWEKAEKIPAKYLPALYAITPEKTAEVQRWADYDLDGLREISDLTYTKLARALQSSRANLTTWRRDGRIPRDRLPFVQELKKKLPQQQECA